MPFLDDDGVTRLVQDLVPYFSNRDALDDVFANFATIETSSTASKAYSVNDLLVKDDVLYRVTSNIASGATITVGTNVVALQIEDIYDLVNTKLNISDYRSGMTWAELEDAITWGEFEGDISDSGTTYTENYHLTKPGLQSDASIIPINGNYDIIDEAVAGTQSSIAMIESHTAQSNHAVGSYFMLDNVLHKATSAIASGETITSGGNATPITLEQALSALNSSVNNLQSLLGQVPFVIAVERREITDLNSLSNFTSSIDGPRMRVDDVMGTSCANTPVTGNGAYIVFTICSSDYVNYGLQFAFSYALVGTHLYMRRYGAKVWDNWTTIA